MIIITGGTSLLLTLSNSVLINKTSVLQLAIYDQIRLPTTAATTTAIAVTVAIATAAT
jgi:hypothetical protein